MYCGLSPAGASLLQGRREYPLLGVPKVRQVLILISAALALFATIVFANEKSASPTPLSFLRTHDTAARAILAQAAGDTLAAGQRHQLKEHINSAFDFAELGKLALGDHWATRSLDEQTLFVDTFGSILAEQNFISFVDYYHKGVKIDFQDEEVDQDKAVVRAQVPTQDIAVDIIYLLHHQEGQWRVYDLVIDDASTATGHRKRYARYLNKKPFEKLLLQLQSQHDRLLAQ